MVAFITKNLERLTHKMPFFEVFFYGYYRKLIKEEIKWLKLKPTDHVLLIGGGPLPMSAHLFYRLGYRRLTILDCDPQAVALGRIWLERKKMDGVHYQLGCALNTSFDRFQAIHVAKQVHPKSVLATRLLENASPGTKVMFRQPPSNLPSHALKMSFDSYFHLVKSCSYFVL